MLVAVLTGVYQADRRMVDPMVRGRLADLGPAAEGFEVGPITGSFLSGRAEVHGFRAELGERAGVRVALELDRAVLGFSPWAALSGGEALREVSLHGAASGEGGEPALDELSTVPGPVADVAMPTIARFRIAGVEIPVDRHRLEVAACEAAPLHSGLPVWAFALGARARGRIDGRDYTLESRTGGTGVVTRITAQGLAAEHWTPHFKGILSWIVAGTMDARVEVESGTRFPGDGVTMRFLLLLREMESQVPDDETTENRLLLGPAMAELVRRRDELPLEFEFRVGAEELAAARGFGDLDLGKRVSKAAGARLEAMAGELTADLPLSGGIDGESLKRLFKKRGK